MTVLEALIEARDCFSYWSTTPCLTALLGEDPAGCGCASCTGAFMLQRCDAALRDATVVATP